MKEVLEIVSTSSYWYLIIYVEEMEEDFIGVKNVNRHYVECCWLQVSVVGNSVCLEEGFLSVDHNFTYVVGIVLGKVEVSY